MRPDPSQRTYRLTERVPALCQLTALDVDFLLAQHRRHVRLAPAGEPGVYRVTALGHVGTVVAPSCRLHIRPKLALRNLCHLLDPGAAVPVREDEATPEPGDGILDFLALRLAQLLTERAAAGLHRDYQERVAALRFLQGRLDLPTLLRESPLPTVQLPCRFDTFTTSVPCNQVPKATAEALLGSPLLSTPAQAALRQALRSFVEVESIPLTRAAVEAAVVDRRTEAYQTLLDLCRLLAQGLGPGGAAGPVACPAFLLDLERVFERYITAGVRAELPPGRYAVAAQPLFQVNRPSTEVPDWPLRPDVVVYRAGRPRLILDAKWKRLSTMPRVTPDLYQLLAYCTALGVRRGVLVYPGRRDRTWTYTLAEAPVRIDIHAVRVTGCRAACVRALQRLGRALRRRPAEES